VLTGEPDTGRLREAAVAPPAPTRRRICRNRSTVACPCRNAQRHRSVEPVSSARQLTGTREAIQPSANSTTTAGTTAATPMAGPGSTMRCASRGNPVAADARTGRDRGVGWLM
jgi:hypothetical protein